jgi:hypothetical protein
MILNALVEKLKRRSKDDFKGRHFEATLILQAASWYLRNVDCPISGPKWDSWTLRRSERRRVAAICAAALNEREAQARGSVRARATTPSRRGGLDWV